MWSALGAMRECQNKKGASFGTPCRKGILIIVMNIHVIVVIILTAFVMATMLTIVVVFGIGILGDSYSCY